MTRKAVLKNRDGSYVLSDGRIWIQELPDIDFVRLNNVESFFGDVVTYQDMGATVIIDSEPFIVLQEVDDDTTRSRINAG